MPPRITEAEKERRGTLNKSRTIKPRPLDQILEEIAETEQSLDDMRFNLTAASKAIRSEGVLIAVCTRNNAGNEVRTQKLNPAFKLQREALSAIKSMKRALVLLHEEESFCTAKVTEEDEWSQFK